jgi:hypothetical protein
LNNDNVNANTAAGKGGGVFNGFFVIRNHPVSGKVLLDRDTSMNRNSAAAGGGIDVAAGTVTVDGATVAHNIPDNCRPADCQEPRRLALGSMACKRRATR